MSSNNFFVSEAKFTDFLTNAGEITADKSVYLLSIALFFSRNIRGQSRKLYENTPNFGRF